MKVSLNTVQSLVDFELPPVDELVARINAQLGGVEEIIDLGARYNDALIVKVVECEKHPNADKLSVCKIDDDGTRQGVGRDENGLVQVVCGAPNVRTDMWAVWLPPESTVPSTFDDGEPFKLDTRELRGILSQGMLAAGDELAINSDHDGIVEITESDIASHDSRATSHELKAGARFAEVFGLDDTILDIENKMFTHRPDCFGQLGVAREISAILKGLPKEGEDMADMRFVNPDWYWLVPQFGSGDGLAISVFNDASDKVPRFMAVALKNVKLKPSPLWLQCALVAMGSKPINNVVDATNYMMLMTAQPTHAYDYDTLRGNKLGARMARSGESVTLLNGKTYELDEDDIVIADGEGVVGLAGIMGGRDTEVNEETKNIVLECANFDMYMLRKTAMKHGLFTDALTRFNKGQSPLQCDRVLAQLIEMIDAEQASDVYDLPEKISGPAEVSLSGEMKISKDFVNQRLGSDLSVEQIGGLLRRINFASYPADDNKETLLMTAPFWRTDISLPEDLVEEVGRLYGFEKSPRELPMRSSKPAPKNLVRETKRKIRESLSKLGANEVLTYSFVHEKVLKNAEQDVGQAFRLSNALSPDLQYYRLSVLPSLLDRVHMNIKAGHDEFVLYEIGKGHNKKYHASDDEGLPRELNFVDAVYASRKPQDNGGAAYFYMRQFVDQLAADNGFTLRYKPISEPLDYPVTAPFDQKRSALVETEDGIFIGIVGELKTSVKKNFKLPQHTAAMSLDLEGLEAAMSQLRQTYRPLSRYPSVVQDISLKIRSEITYDELVRIAAEAASHYADVDSYIEPMSIYRATNETDTKTITLRLVCTSHQKTLTTEEVGTLVAHVVDMAHAACGAEQV